MPAAYLCTPADVIKTRLQVNHYDLMNILIFIKCLCAVHIFKSLIIGDCFIQQKTNLSISLAHSFNQCNARNLSHTEMHYTCCNVLKLYIHIHPLNITIRLQSLYRFLTNICTSFFAVYCTYIMHCSLWGIYFWGTFLAYVCRHYMPAIQHVVL